MTFFVGQLNQQTHKFGNLRNETKAIRQPLFKVSNAEDCQTQRYNGDTHTVSESPQMAALAVSHVN